MNDVVETFIPAHFLLSSAVFYSMSSMLIEIVCACFVRDTEKKFACSSTPFSEMPLYYLAVGTAMRLVLENAFMFFC